ncbi:hypothetical protein FHU37_004782 [Allostreptomyces psammosilenae]|uniref:Uncharacterized protein n=1 Tax=Allostreptomyces psammosilenae TaxID=1892865 RepID=A0A852ZZE6_9ACTN|nr:hypothetical protein [Allostreptomyces psammosilenae]
MAARADGRAHPTRAARRAAGHHLAEEEYR